jgi:hypothetical protein
MVDGGLQDGTDGDGGVATAIAVEDDGVLDGDGALIGDVDVFDGDGATVDQPEL